MIGAGAGSSKVAGVNCEVNYRVSPHKFRLITHIPHTQMMVNARAPVNSDPGHNNTQIAKVSTEVCQHTGIWDV